MEKIECQSRLTHFVINLIVHDITWHFVFIVFIVFAQSMVVAAASNKPPQLQLYMLSSHSRIQTTRNETMWRLFDHILQHLRHKWVDRIELRGK